MPGWHAKTKDLVTEGKLKVLGIVEEQHADRAVLFMQWHQMDWPVLADPLNLLGVKAIPYTFLIDEHGIIRYKNPKPADLATFLGTDYAKPADIEQTPLALKPDSAESRLLWGNASDLDLAIEQFEARTSEQPKDAEAFFRLGVALRERFDSPQRKPDDFAGAIAAWSEALKLKPSQYIWRRRIQQYGPRLDKPYSFYDWVVQAREEIVARGETPQVLEAEPSGSEFAQPGGRANAKPGDEPEPIHPDPDGKLPQDEAALVLLEPTVVPSTDKKSPACRVHLRFLPDGSRKVHWSNDAGPLSFFIDDHPGVSIHDIQLPPTNRNSLTSHEERTVEFEVRPATGRDTLPDKLSGAAFYFICEDIGGQCQFLRQDIEISLK
ncbi:MAG: hypothetical protein ACR2RV_23590 [Verrucomicrobiales bacterium]